MNNDLVIITDFDGVLQGILPAYNFADDFCHWFENLYNDDEVVQDFYFDPPHRFEKYEQVELKVECKSGEEFHFQVQKSSLDAPQQKPKQAFVLHCDEYDQPVGVVVSSDEEEFFDKCHKALAEHYDPDEGFRQIRNLDYHSLDWGESVIFDYDYIDNGEDTNRVIRITKSVCY